MPIDGGLRKSLQPGTKLVAIYRKAEHRAEVIEGEDGRLRFKLDDGREFTSPSAAASAVMGGIAANGWRFWSLMGDEPPSEATVAPKAARKAAAPRKGPKAAKPAPEAATEPEETPEPEAATDEPAAE